MKYINCSVRSNTLTSNEDRGCSQGDPICFIIAWIPLRSSLTEMFTSAEKQAWLLEITQKFLTKSKSGNIIKNACSYV